MSPDVSTLIIAMIGSPILVKVIEIVAGSGKRLRAANRRADACYELAVEYRRAAVKAGVDVTDWSPLPE